MQTIISFGIYISTIRKKSKAEYQEIKTQSAIIMIIIYTIPVPKLKVAITKGSSRTLLQEAQVKNFNATILI